MGKASTTRSWLHWLRARSPSHALDPADLGTAFGLEMSFDTVDAVVAPPLRATPGWVRRLAAWRRAPT